MDTPTRTRRMGLRAVLLAAAVATVSATALSAPASARSTAAPAAATAATATAQSSLSHCYITWGSGPRAKNLWVSSSITNVRAGRQVCFDRMVVDLKGRPPGWDVRYVTNVYEEGSGDVVPLRGGAKLRVIVRAPAYNINTGQPTYTPANPNELVNVYGFWTFRQIAWAGSFEGQTTIGLGVRARLPFRVFPLYSSTTNTSRLVIDVAHHWS